MFRPILFTAKKVTLINHSHQAVFFINDRQMGNKIINQQLFGFLNSKLINVNGNKIGIHNASQTLIQINIAEHSSAKIRVSKDALQAAITVDSQNNALMSLLQILYCLFYTNIRIHNDF